MSSGRSFSINFFREVACFDLEALALNRRTKSSSSFIPSSLVLEERPTKNKSPRRSMSPPSILASPLIRQICAPPILLTKKSEIGGSSATLDGCPGTGRRTCPSTITAWSSTNKQSGWLWSASSIVTDTPHDSSASRYCWCCMLANSISFGPLPKKLASADLYELGMARTSARVFWSKRTVAIVKSRSCPLLMLSPIMESHFRMWVNEIF